MHIALESSIEYNLSWSEERACEISGFSRVGIDCTTQSHISASLVEEGLGK